MKSLVVLSVLFLASAVSAGVIDVVSDVITFNAEQDVFFILYTRANPDGLKITKDPASIDNSTFNPANPVRFIIHGFLNNKYSDVNVDIRKAYLIRGDFNVIVVDWGWGAITPDYISARYRIKEVSLVLSNLITMLLNGGYTTRSQVTIVGHSLGGQTACLTAKKITGGKIAAVIALDPAGPLFDFDKPDERCAPDDAVYVEIIHTNGGRLGFAKPIGQADFYINYGRTQNGVEWDITGTSSHLRAPTYFAESINNNQYIGMKCLNYDEVSRRKCTNQSSGYAMGGEPPNSGLSGIFYVNTNSGSPFGKGL